MQPSLYERLGGVYAIAVVVDDFVDRVMKNPVLNANPKVQEAHHKVPPAGFKYLVTELVCWATGGPQEHSTVDRRPACPFRRASPRRTDLLCLRPGPLAEEPTRPGRGTVRGDDAEGDVLGWAADRLLYAVVEQNGQSPS